MNKNNKLKLLKVGCVYKLIDCSDSPRLEAYTSDNLIFLKTNDTFLVLESEPRFRWLSKFTYGNTIFNKILLNNKVYSFWYWDDCDFYLEIEKYIVKVI